MPATSEDKQLDMIFLYSRNAVPAMLDMVQRAKELGFTPLLIVLDLEEPNLIVDYSCFDFEILKIKVTYKGVGLERVRSMQHIYSVLSKLVKYRLKAGGYVMTSAFDLLFVTCLVRAFRSFGIRHQVRDLHKLQLDSGLVSRVLKLLERIMLGRVELLVVSSQGFIDGYYEEIYSGSTLLLENFPSVDVWNGFEREFSNPGELVIGYIGILRYKKSLSALVEAVECLRSVGRKVRVVFAGGVRGNLLSEIQSKITLSEGFVFSGPYEYSKDIQMLYSKIDLIYAIYDENDHNCKLAMPTKFYESILSGRPIIVAANTFVGNQVESRGMGRAVCLGNVGELEEVLDQAMNQDSWFREAQKCLQSTDISDYVKRHEIALDESVMVSVPDTV